MYRQLSLHFHQLTPHAGADSEYFNARGARLYESLARSVVRDLRMTGRLVALLDDQTQYNMVIWYCSRGTTQDVFSLNWRKLGGGEVQVVMKLVEMRYLGEPRREVRAACHVRMTDMVPERYGLYENVEASIQHPGMLGRRQPGYTASLRLEALHGDDVAVAFQLEDMQDCVRRALDLWRGAVEFIMEWQFREGARREARRYYYFLDVNPKNKCALAWISDIYLGGISVGCLCRVLV